jgi:hypothetical protein
MDLAPLARSTSIFTTRDMQSTNGEDETTRSDCHARWVLLSHDPRPFRKLNNWRFCVFWLPRVVRTLNLTHYPPLD